MRNRTTSLRPNPLAFALAAAVLAAAPALPVKALPQQAADALASPETVTVDAPIRAVTLYQGRAMVTRTAVAPAAQGLFEMRFTGLPASVDESSLQATVTGAARLLDVRFEQTVTETDASTNPALRELIAKLEAARREGERLALEGAHLANRQAFLDAIRAKTASEAAKEVGTKALDPESLRQQMAFLDESQTRLIADRMKLEGAVRQSAESIRVLESQVQSLGGETKAERVAVVSIGKASAAAGEVSLRYLVRDAGWAPRYAVRADLEQGVLAIEYDAEIRQATGEDWNGVALSLSTAEPTRRAMPRDMPSAYVDLLPPPTIGAGVAGGMRPGAYRGTTGAPEMAPGMPGGEVMFDAVVMKSDSSGRNEALARAFADAAAASAGTVVAYEIPRATTIPSDASRARRLRIATIDTKPSFMHVARPLVEDSVYIRAKAANDSAFQFLSGAATVFVGGDSVGVLTLPAVAPGGEMVFWLGVDPRVTAKRMLVKKESVTKGVFDKADVTRWDFRVDLSSTAAMPVQVELVDRIPVSRNEQIKVELVNDPKQGGAPLSTDAKYLADERPQGVLRWDLSIPARADAGKPATRSVSWSVLVSKPKDVAITGLPE